MIYFKAYEKKYINRFDEIDGGTMWFSDNNFHFDNGKGKIVDIKNAPFELKDVMLGSPFKIKDKIIYENDIILIKSKNLKAKVVLIDKKGWFLINEEENFNSDLKQTLKNFSCEIISNQCIEDDDIDLGNNHISHIELQTILDNIYNNLLENKNFIDLIFSFGSNEIEFIFRSKRSASAFCSKLINENKEEFSLLRQKFNSFYTENNVVIVC